MRLTKKQQAELLFEEFFNITKSTNVTRKRAKESEILHHKSFLHGGDDIVADSPKRFSGTFTRETRSVQSRTPTSDDGNDSADEKFVGEGPSQETLVHLVQRNVVQAEGSPETAGAIGVQEIEPVDEANIHRTADNIAKMGDEVYNKYGQKLQNAETEIVDKMKKKGSSATYNTFCTVLSEVLSQDRDLATFSVTMHLLVGVTSRLTDLQGMVKRYIGEELADDAVKCIEEQCQEKE